MERETEQEVEDERREAAMASAASLRPNFKHKGGLTGAHLSKFQQLHKRRLQMKAKSKVNKRDKGGGSGDGRSKSRKVATGIHDQETSKLIAGDSTSARIPESKSGIISSAEQENVAEDLAAKKRPKLYWGLDTKERWERKSNM